MAADRGNVSEGQLILAIGTGWEADEEVAYGYEWPDAPERLRAM